MREQLIRTCLMDVPTSGPQHTLDLTKGKRRIMNVVGRSKIENCIEAAVPEGQQTRIPTAQKAIRSRFCISQHSGVEVHTNDLSEAMRNESGHTMTATASEVEHARGQWEPEDAQRKGQLNVPHGEVALGDIWKRLRHPQSKRVP